MNILEVHAAASVTIQFFVPLQGDPVDWMQAREHRVGRRGISFADCKDDSRVHFCIYRLKSSSYCSIQKKIITTELQINRSNALVKLIGDLNNCET